MYQGRGGRDSRNGQAPVVEGVEAGWLEWAPRKRILGVTHRSFTQGSGHGASHPHLAHEFAMALVERRDPFLNAKESANWTCVGPCTHESASKGGAIVGLPSFTL